MIFQRQHPDFNQTVVCYSSSFGITRPSNLGCSTFCKRILPLTRSRPAIPYGAYFVCTFTSQAVVLALLTFCSILQLDLSFTGQLRTAQFTLSSNALPSLQCRGHSGPVHNPSLTAVTWTSWRLLSTGCTIHSSCGCLMWDPKTCFNQLLAGYLQGNDRKFHLLRHMLDREHQF